MSKCISIRKRLTIDGQVMTYKEAAKQFNLSVDTIFRTVKTHRTNQLRSSWLMNRRGGWPLGRPKKKISSKESERLKRLNRIPGPGSFELLLLSQRNKREN